MSLPIGHGRKKLQEIDWILAKPCLSFGSPWFYSNTINTEHSFIMHPEKKGQTSRRIANSRLLTFSPSCFDFFIMIWVAVRIASNKLKSRKGEEECEEEENRKCNCIIENLEKRVGNKNSFLVISLFYKVLLSRLVCYSNLCVSKSKRVPRIMLCWWGQLFGSLITSISPFVP